MMMMTLAIYEWFSGSAPSPRPLGPLALSPDLVEQVINLTNLAAQLLCTSTVETTATVHKRIKTQMK